MFKLNAEEFMFVKEAMLAMESLTKSLKLDNGWKDYKRFAFESLMKRIKETDISQLCKERVEELGEKR